MKFISIRFCYTRFISIVSAKYQRKSMEKIGSETKVILDQNKVRKIEWKNRNEIQNCNFIFLREDKFKNWKMKKNLAQFYFAKSKDLVKCMSSTTRNTIYDIHITCHSDNNFCHLLTFANRSDRDQVRTGAPR